MAKPRHKQRWLANSLHKHREYQVKGWFSEANKRWYRNKVSGITDGMIVEVGVYGGASALSIMDICLRNRNVLYGIDPWEWLPSTNKLEFTTRRELREKLSTIIQCYGYDGTINLIQGFSQEAINQFDDLSLDLVFIDGDHTYDAVCEDLSWWSKVKDGGTLSGHDYGAKDRSFGVTRAVDEFVSSNRLKANLTIHKNIWEIVKK